MFSKSINLITLVILSYVFLTYDLCAQSNGIKYMSSLQSALGTNTSVLKGINSLLGNPGAIAETNDEFAIMASTEQRFFLSSLNSTNIGVIKRIGSEDYIGVSIGFFGINEYQEKRFSLSYSRKIGPNTYIGCTANYYQLAIDEYGSQSDVDLNIGLKSRITKHISVGVAAYNIFSSPDHGYLRMHTNISTGIQYTISNKVDWLLEIRTDFENYSAFSTGINYHIIDSLNIQLGMNTIDNGIALGFSYNINNKMRIAAASRSNQNLGISPSFTLIYHK